MKNYQDLARLAEYFGFHVTSTTGGAHNVGSKHFRGLAIDVRTRDKSSAECEKFISACQTLGVIVRDERRRPARQRVWSGAHIHLEIGTGTAASVREFQRRSDLVVDGIAGEKTLAALNA